MKENPRYNVVSVRITDEERKVLRRIGVMTSKSVSEIMREAIQLAMAQTGCPPVDEAVMVKNQVAGRWAARSAKFA